MRFQQKINIKKISIQLTRRKMQKNIYTRYLLKIETKNRKKNFRKNIFKKSE